MLGCSTSGQVIGEGSSSRRASSSRSWCWFGCSRRPSTRRVTAVVRDLDLATRDSATCISAVAGRATSRWGERVNPFLEVAKPHQDGQSAWVPTVAVLSSAEMSGELVTDIRQLLAQAFDGRFSQEDWEHTLGRVHVVVSDAVAVVSHAAVVPRILEVAHRPFDAGYVEGVVTAPGQQGQGLASLAMARVSTLIRGSFAMGGLSTSRHGFYERLGWERWRGPTFVRDGSEELRTEEDDDGVMVLRFGVSRDIDLTGSLSCERRRGDNW